MQKLIADNRPQWVVVLALTGTLLFLGLVPEPRQELALPVPDALPDQLAGYQGFDWLYCQSEQCMASFRADEMAAGTTNCPTCSGQLGSMSLAEKTILPRGTIVVKKGYESLGAPTLFVSLVISGAERRGIHKPQVCLKAQGHAIQDQYAVAVPTHSGEALHVTALDLVAPIPGQPDDSPGVARNVYVYWFASTRRTTPHHMARLAWMAYDSVIEGVRGRWAYVAIATSRDGASDEHLQRLKPFIAELNDFLKQHSQPDVTENPSPQ